MAMLRAHAVVEAWAGSFDGLLHKDVAAVNARLAHECQLQEGIRLVPFGSVNPLLPDWEDDLRRCVEEHHMPGIRLHPNYHGYGLDHPAFARLLKLAAERKLVVQLAVIMEDERMMNAHFRVPPVDLRPLVAQVQATAGLQLILLNALTTVRGNALVQLRERGIYVDVSMLDGLGGVAGLLNQLPLDRVLFGSYAPFFYFDSALLKLKESALTEPQLRAVCHDNARRLLPAKP
jgi:predicted TIM-barrel fold metal-dependent hydrolase